MTNQVLNVSNCYTEDDINDMLVVAAIAYERCLESTGYVRSVLYLEPMMNQLRDGDNSVILRMIKCFSGFAPFIVKNYPELIDIITDNIGPIQSTIH
jgi:hypothetical protein